MIKVYRSMGKWKDQLLIKSYLLVRELKNEGCVNWSKHFIKAEILPQKIEKVTAITIRPSRQWTILGFHVTARVKGNVCMRMEFDFLRIS